MLVRGQRSEDQSQKSELDCTDRIPSNYFDFRIFKAAYPERSGRQLWPAAIRAANARLKEGATFQAMIEGAARYAAHCDALDETGTQYVMQAATFLGPGKQCSTNSKRFF